MICSYFVKAEREREREREREKVLPKGGAYWRNWCSSEISERRSEVD